MTIIRNNACILINLAITNLNVFGRLREINSPWTKQRSMCCRNPKRRRPRYFRSWATTGSCWTESSCGQMHGRDTHWHSVSLLRSSVVPPRVMLMLMMTMMIWMAVVGHRRRTVCTASAPFGPLQSTPVHRHSPPQTIPIWGLFSLIQ